MSQRRAKSGATPALKKYQSPPPTLFIRIYLLLRISYSLYSKELLVLECPEYDLVIHLQNTEYLDDL